MPLAGGGQHRRGQGLAVGVRQRPDHLLLRPPGPAAGHPGGTLRRALHGRGRVRGDRQVSDPTGLFYALKVEIFVRLLLLHDKLKLPSNCLVGLS